MARIRRKKALYEVISRSRPKPGVTGPPPAPEEKPPRDEQGTGESVKQKPPGTTQWPTRPRIVQFNAGRVEFSMPYQLAVAVLLGIVFLVLLFYRLGQWSVSEIQKPNTADMTAVPDGIEVPRPGPGEAVGQPQPLPPAAPAADTGDHVIVLVEYARRADLVPVQRHFAEYGVETEIVPKSDGGYYLWTKSRYGNPERPGTDGYVEIRKAKQRIVRIGALYKGRAPENYETFAPHYFSDAYGMKTN